MQFKTVFLGALLMAALSAFTAKAESFEVSNELATQEQTADWRDGGWGGHRGGQWYSMECSSWDNAYASCPVNGRIYDMRLRHEISNGRRCNRSGSWGYSSNMIWVDEGCRALFDVLIGW